MKRRAKRNERWRAYQQRLAALGECLRLRDPSGMTGPPYVSFSRFTSFSHCQSAERETGPVVTEISGKSEIPGKFRAERPKRDKNGGVAGVQSRPGGRG